MSSEAPPRPAPAVARLAALALVGWALAGCGARVGIPNAPSLDGGPPAAASDGTVGCQTQYPCPTAGAALCVGQQISRCVDQGGGCLGWTVATGCGLGMTCVGNTCVDACTTPELEKLCDQAADDAANCCAGSGAAPLPSDVCHDLVKRGIDPLVGCPQFTLQTTCDAVRDMLVGAGGCCCPTDYVCDPENGNRCALACLTAPGCSGDPGGSVCCPAGTGGVVGSAAYLCRPDDGKPLHGCRYFANNGCDGGTECWKDPRGNSVCTRSCTVDADCGNPGVACCNTRAKCNITLGGCSGRGACLPC